MARRPFSISTTPSPSLPPSSGPAVVMNEDTWKTRIDQKVDFVSYALEAARTGGPPPLLRPKGGVASSNQEEAKSRIDIADLPRGPSLCAPPDPVLFSFVRKRLLRVAESELQEDSWIDQGHVQAVPEASRIASDSFQAAIESFAKRNDFFAAAQILEDWLRFMPLQKHAPSPLTEIAKLSFWCVRALRNHSRLAPQDSATCHDLTQRLLRASKRLRASWSTQTHQIAMHLFIPAEDLDSAVNVLTRELITWWSVKQQLGPEDHRQDSLNLQKFRFVNRNVGKTIHAVSALLLKKRDMLQQQSADPDSQLVREYFLAVSKLSQSFATGSLLPFSEVTNRKWLLPAPYSIMLTQLCRAQEVANGLVIRNDELNSVVRRRIHETHRRIFIFIQASFSTSAAQSSGESQVSAYGESLDEIRASYFAKCQPSLAVCRPLLRYSLRYLASSELATAIMRYSIDAAKKEVRLRGEEMAQEQKNKSQEDQLEADVPASDGTTDETDAVGTAMSDAHQPGAISYRYLRAANTTLLNEAVRLREPVLEESALRIILSEELDSSWVTGNLRSSSLSKPSSESSPDAANLTRRDTLALILSALSERDFHRVSTILRFLRVHGLIRHKYDPRHHQEWCQVGDLSIEFIHGRDIFKLFFPSLHSQITLGGGHQKIKGHTAKEVDILSDPRMRADVLITMVHCGTWSCVEPLWHTIFNYCEEQTISNRDITVVEATALMRFYSGLIKLMLPRNDSAAPDSGEGDDSGQEQPRHSVDLRSVQECVDDVLSVRGRLRDEYTRLFQRWKGGGKEGWASLMARSRAAIPDAKFFGSVLNGLGWPLVGRLAQGDQRTVMSYDKDVVSDSCLQNGINNHRYEQVCQALLTDEESADFLLRVLEDAHGHGVKIPEAYLDDILPSVGRNSDHLRSRANQVKKMLTPEKHEKKRNRSEYRHVQTKKDRGIYDSPWRRKKKKRDRDGEQNVETEKSSSGQQS
ncbi:unnamed protein product [Sympodiomycopsis kandeliae]